MSLHQSTSLWFWLLAGLFLVDEWRHPLPLLPVLFCVLGCIALRIIAYYLVELAPPLARWFIPVCLGLLCLVILI